MTINKIISAQQQSGDGTVLQPAQPLSPEVRAALFDEFATTTPASTSATSGQTVFFALVLAAALAFAALYILKKVRPHDFQD